MKHSDLQQEYQALQLRETLELIEAVKAHGGTYVFPDGDMPIIVGAWKHSERAEDFYVTSVLLDENGALVVDGCPVGSSRFITEPIVYFEYGHISYITDYIPEAEDISDVSLEPRLECCTIESLDRDDLKTLGYDPDVSNDVFQQIAWKTGELLDDDAHRESFWEALNMACKEYKIPELEGKSDLE